MDSFYLVINIYRFNKVFKVIFIDGDSIWGEND